MKMITALEAQSLGIKQATLRKWVQRGHVRKYGRDRYDFAQVYARWRALPLDDSPIT